MIEIAEEIRKDGDANSANRVILEIQQKDANNADVKVSDLKTMIAIEKVVSVNAKRIMMATNAKSVRFVFSAILKKI